MKTRMMPAGPEAYDEAARLLRDGELVAFPTETVYGLGANALDADAVRSIFAAKGRPADNPLIVHIHERGQLEPLCEIPPRAEKLMDAFWPGPLPIAAPSANRSGRPSPTTAAHVMEDMDGIIPLIVDGGSCEVGLESTVLDLCHGAPCILRPGGITREMLEGALGEPVELADSILRPLQPGETALSPGMRYKHYAPKGTVTLVEGPEERVVKKLREMVREAREEGKRACALCFSEHVEALADCDPHDLGPRTDEREIAHRLFDVLRELDEEGMEAAFSEVVPPEGVGLAVMNRLGRAAAFQTIHA